MRRAAAVLAIVVGIGLVVEPLALKLFPRAAAGERITGRFRQTMSRRGLEQLQTNFATVGAFTTGLTDQTIPYLTRRLHMTRAEFDRYLDTDFPAVAIGVREIPPAAAFVGPVIPRLVASHDDFVAIDSLPGLGLPITAIPWLLLGVGVLLVATGALALSTARALPLIALLVIGAAMVVVAFAFSLPSKADDAGRIAALGRVALSAQAATKALAATKVIDATVDQTRATMLPAIARRLRVPPSRLNADVAQRSPAVATGLREWDSIRPGAYQLAAIQGRSVADNRQMSGTPFTALPWLVIGPGAAIAPLAALARLSVGRAGQSRPRDGRRI
jgi:hypothetical protein